MKQFLMDLFKRIEYQYHGKEFITFTDLPALMTQFAYHIPFENMDIMNQKHYTINKDFLYSKIVEHHRGGLCYELNPLFFYVLKELGFNVQMIQATINSSKKTLQNTHISTVLYYGGERYLVDVGFGANQALEPVPFTSQFVFAVGGSYRVRDLLEKGEFVYEKYNDNTLEISYTFTLTEISDLEVNQAKNIVTTHSESPFNKGLILTQTIPKGHQTLTDTTFTTVKDGKKHKEYINEDRRHEIGLQVYGIDLEEADGLDK